MSTFRASYSGIGDMLKSAEMQAAMLRLIEKAKVRAEEIAPVDETSGHPGRYKAAFSVSCGVQHHKTARAYGRLTNDAPEAFFVEFGTVHNPRRRVLARALDAI